MIATEHCKSILIVEDEMEIRENLKALLELEGYKVFTAIHGRDALEVIRKMPRPCLILLDLLMPIMTGEELLAVMTREDGLATIPVCIVSGVADRPRAAKGLPFIKKPINFEGLLKFVKQYCGEPHQS